MTEKCIKCHKMYKKGIGFASSAVKITVVIPMYNFFLYFLIK